MAQKGEKKKREKEERFQRFHLTLARIDKKVSSLAAGAATATAAWKPEEIRRKKSRVFFCLGREH